MDDIIQIVMGWDDYHLHHFEIGGSLYGEPCPEDKDYDLKVLDERTLKLGTLADNGQRTFGYVYDYGDNWHCMVVLEATSAAAPGVTYPRLIEGARHGPPEDRRRSLGLPRIPRSHCRSQTPASKRAHDLERRRLNPENLDRDEINRTLRRLSPRKRPRRK
jgi:hypothetical protein